MISKLLSAISDRLPWRSILRRDDSPYLDKHLIWRSSEEKSAIRIHLHHFLSGDADAELHNHPWRWAVSLILSGGYREEHRTPAGRVRVHMRRPFTLNFIRANTFHRVDLIDNDCWTLFISGPVIQSWGFWDRILRDFTPWREFNAARGMKVPVRNDYWRMNKR